MEPTKSEDAPKEVGVMGVIVGQQAPSVKLIRGQKGNYGFEIKIFGDDKAKLLKELRKVHDVLVNVYCDKNFKLLEAGEDENN